MSNDTSEIDEPDNDFAHERWKSVLVCTGANACGKVSPFAGLVF